jgi:hypothetical protein
MTSGSRDVAFDRLEQREPVHDGHAQVGDDDVGRVGLDAPQGVGAVVGLFDDEACAAQVAPTSARTIGESSTIITRP